MVKPQRLLTGGHLWDPRPLLRALIPSSDRRSQLCFKEVPEGSMEAWIVRIPSRLDGLDTTRLIEIV